MKGLLKEVVWSIVVNLRINNFFRLLNKDKIRILMYHGIVKHQLSPFCWTQLEVEKFKKQLIFLKHNYRVLKLSEVIVSIREGKQLPSNTAVITFDDGLRTNLTVAYPILKQLNLPATIFLATGLISKNDICWPDKLYLHIKYTKKNNIDLTKFGLRKYYLTTDIDRSKAFEETNKYLKSIAVEEKDYIMNHITTHLPLSGYIGDHTFNLMSWDEIRTMDREGLIEFGAHTVNHNILTRLRQEEMENEILDSCKSIGDRLGKRCQLFAYPNGLKSDFNVSTRSVLKDNGILCGLTTISGLFRVGEDVYEMPRIGIGADMTSARFQCHISGTVEAFKIIAFGA